MKKNELNLKIQLKIMKHTFSSIYSITIRQFCGRVCRQINLKDRRTRADLRTNFNFEKEKKKAGKGQKNHLK